MSHWKEPRPFSVYCTVKPNKRNGASKEFTSRVGTAQDILEVQKLITDDLKAMGNTFGGFMEPADTSGRTYRVFKAKWTEYPLHD